MHRVFCLCELGHCDTPKCVVDVDSENVMIVWICLITM